MFEAAQYMPSATALVAGVTVMATPPAGASNGQMAEASVMTMTTTMNGMTMTTTMTGAMSTMTGMSGMSGMSGAADSARPVAAVLGGAALAGLALL